MAGSPAPCPQTQHRPCLAPGSEQLFQEGQPRLSLSFWYQKVLRLSQGALQDRPREMCPQGATACNTSPRPFSTPPPASLTPTHFPSEHPFLHSGEPCQILLLPGPVLPASLDLRQQVGGVVGALCGVWIHPEWWRGSWLGTPSRERVVHLKPEFGDAGQELQG